MGRWNRYWFAEGGRLGLACVRIAVAVSALWVLAKIAALPDAIVAPREVYRAVGIWHLLGATPPPGALVTALWWIAWISTAAMLLGARTRTAVAISAVSVIALASLVYSGMPTWKHSYNVVLVAQLALLGGHAGDALGVDALLRRLRRQPALDRARAYQWSIRLVQLAVALMFAGAAFHKIAQGHFTLRWALSDSLRNHLLIRFDLANLPRPPVAAWLVDSVWRYRLVALLNLASQLAPLVAVFWIRRPLVRAAAGLCFVAECLGLGLVVALWDLQWLPLYAAFIDWDALVARLARRPAPPSLSGLQLPRPAPFVPPRGPRRYVIAFVTYDCLCSFVPTLAQRLHTYPFTSYPMFSQIRANPPYDEHVAYGVPGDRFEALASEPIPPNVTYFLDHVNRGAYASPTSRDLQARLGAVLAVAQTRYPGLGWRGLRHRLSLFVAPPYPAPAHLEEHGIAITGELAVDGTFRSLLGSLHGATLTLDPQQLDVSGDVRFQYYADDMPEPHDLPATRTGSASFELAGLTADPVYVVALVDGQPWLAAARRSWRWGR